MATEGAAAAAGPPPGLPAPTAPASFSFDDAAAVESVDSLDKRELALFQWLSALDRDLQRATKDSLKPHQSHIERSLLKYLGSSHIVKPSRPIRQLIARSLVSLYHRGESRTVFDTVATAQTALGNKKLDDQTVKISESNHHLMLALAFDVTYASSFPSFSLRASAWIYTIGIITEAHGPKVMSLCSETITIYIKILKNARDTEIALRFETLKSSARALRGAGKAANEAMLRDLVRFAKNGISDKNLIIRQAAVELLEAIYKHTQQPPPTTFAEFETLIASFVKPLDGTDYFTRRAFSNLIASLFGVSQIPGQLSKLSPKRGAKADTSAAAIAAAAEKTILTPEEVLTILANQFTKAASRESRIGIMEAAAAFLRQSGPKFIEAHYAAILKMLVDIVSNPKVAPNRTEAAFVRECCVFIIREVVGKMLTEMGQVNGVREILSGYLKRWPAAMTTEVPPPEQALAFVLYELAALFIDLGPAANECIEGVVDTLFVLLQHPSQTTKIALAWALRSLCLALPEHLSSILTRLVSLLQKDLGLLTPDRPEAIDKIQGYATVLSAVVGVLPIHELYAVYEDAATIFGLSTQLIRTAGNTRDQRIAACQVQTAWSLIGSLMSLGANFGKVHLSQLLLIWKNVFPKTQPKDINATRSDTEWMYQLVSRESALVALYAFLVYNARELASNDVAKRIIVCLNNTLHFLSTLPITYSNSIEQVQITPIQARLYERECLLRKRLFQCYCVIGNPSVFETSHTQLIKATIDIFALDPDKADRFFAPPGTHPKEGAIVIESVMPTSLVKGHAVKVAADSMAEDRGVSGIMTRDTDVQGLEDLIDRRMFGQLDHDPHTMYLSSNMVQTTERADDRGLVELSTTVPAPSPASVAVVDASLELFALLFPLQNVQSQETFSEHLVKASAAQSGKLTPIRKQATQINSLVAVAGVLRYMMVKRGQLTSGKVSVAIRDLADPFLRSADAVHRSIASEIFGRLARVVGTAVFIHPLIQNLVDQVVTHRDPESRAGSALALGCIHSFVGGMAASSHLNTVVGILHSLASDPHPLVHTWALRALWLTIESAGLMYEPFVNSTLTLVVKLFMTESHEPTAPMANMPGSIDFNADVYPAFGRILHALVGVVGPELQLSTSLRTICFSLYDQLKNDEDPFVVVEAIRCIQNFILFARSHVDIETLIPFLQLQLSGDYRTQVYLIRKASVTCLYQLTQRDAETVLSAAIGNRLEEQLFALLDVEMDSMVRDEIKDILMALLGHVAFDKPSRWLELCRGILSKSGAGIASGGSAADGGSGQAAGAVAISGSAGIAGANPMAGGGGIAGAPGVGAAGASGAGAAPGGGDGDDEDDMIDGHADAPSGAPTPSAASNLPAAAGPGAAPAGSSAAAAVAAGFGPIHLPRWRTQVFALACLRLVVKVALNSDAQEHLDLAHARAKRAALAAKGKPSDFLVFRLVDLIRMAFNSSTANVSYLRLGGLYLLRDVLERYAKTPDPDFDGHPLLEQYQAQIIAALAPGFNKESSPEIVSTACNVCSFFIGTSGDPVAMGRPLRLLGGLLEEFSGVGDNKTHAALSPNMFVMLKLAILRAWADLFSYARSHPDLQLAIAPHLDVLVRLWVSVLHDYAKLTMDSDTDGSGYSMESSPGINLYMSATRQATLPFYQSAWVRILRSLADLIEQRSPPALKLLSEAGGDNAALNTGLDGTSVGSDTGLRAKTFYMLFGLCVEVVSGAGVGGGNIGNGNGGGSDAVPNTQSVSGSKPVSAISGVEADPVVVCLESIGKMLRPHVLGQAFLPEPIFLELLSVYDRLVQTRDASVQLIVVETLDQVLSDFGASYFAKGDGPHPMAIESTSHLAAIPAVVVDPATGGDGGVEGIKTLGHHSQSVLYRVVSTLFTVFAIHVPGVSPERAAMMSANRPANADTTQLVIKAFGALARAASRVSAPLSDRVSVTAILFIVLIAILRSGKFSTDAVARIVVQVKPMLDSFKMDGSVEGEAQASDSLGKILQASVADLADVAAKQIEDESGAKLVLDATSTEFGVIKNALLAVVLIVTSCPSLSHHASSQDKVLRVLKTLMVSINVPVSILAAQYARTLVLLSCRPDDTTDAHVGASYLRVLLPIMSTRIAHMASNIASGRDAPHQPVLEEHLKSIVMLAANVQNDRQRLAALAVLVPLFVTALVDIPDPTTITFPSPASKSMHMFSTQALIQLASQQHHAFKTVLHTVLTESQKVTLERAFKSVSVAQGAGIAGSFVNMPAFASAAGFAAGMGGSSAPKIQLKNFAAFE